MHRRAFPLYLLAEGSSLFGNAAIGIVLPWLVLSRTGDPALAGLVAATAATPSIVAAVVGGHLIDLIGRKRISVIADLGSAASVAARGGRPDRRSGSGVVHRAGDLRCDLRRPRLHRA